MLRSKYVSVLLLAFLLYYVVSCIGKTGQDLVAPEPVTEPTATAPPESEPAAASRPQPEPPIKKLPTVNTEVEAAGLRTQLTALERAYSRLPIKQLERGTMAEQVALHSITFTINEVAAQLEKKEPQNRRAATRTQNNLDLAKELVTQLAAKEDPFAKRRGDLRLAYRSELDGSLQPFRLYVPKKINLKRPQPLVVGLHGRSGDENTFMDVFRDRKNGQSIFKNLGDEYGFILVSPRGGGPGSGYRDAAAQDVLDVTALVPELYRIREDGVFLTGHSMGGGGTLLIGLQHPEPYRALAPIAGGLWVPGGLRDLSDAAKNLPVRFYQGTADDIVPADPRALKSTKSTLKNFKFVKFKGEDHSSIFYRAMPEVFAFFAGFL